MAIKIFWSFDCFRIEDWKLSPLLGVQIPNCPNSPNSPNLLFFIKRPHRRTFKKILWTNGTNLFIHVLELLGFNGRVNLANLTRINPCRHGLICRWPWLAKITSWFCPISILLPNMDTDCLIRFKIWKIFTAFDGPSCKKNSNLVMIHYLKNKVGVVDFANAHGLWNFTNPRAVAKSTTPTLFLR